MNTCSYICKNIIMTDRPDTERMDQAAYTLKAISNGTRLCVISLLSKREEMSVSEINEQLNCEQSLLSHHLTDMRAKGILNCRRVGKNCFYSLNNKEIVRVLEFVNKAQ